MWLAVACRPSAASTTAPRAAPEDRREAEVEAAETDALAVVLHSLALVSPGARSISLYEGAALDACAAAGWPEQLPLRIAEKLPDTPTGTRATVVYPGGAAVVTVASVACDHESEPASADLVLVAPAPSGPPETRHPAQLKAGMPGRPHLAVIGAEPQRGASLVDPPPLAHGGADDDALRTALTRRTAEHHARCEAEGEPVPSPDARRIDEAVATSTSYRIATTREPLTFSVVDHEAIMVGCTTQAASVALLLDAAGGVLFELDSSAAIELAWLVDLDGDGAQEAVVDITWVEDALHDVVLLHGERGKWAQTVLWSSPSP